MYTLLRTQSLPLSPADAWAFFSDPRNLDAITPPDMGFELTSDPAFAGSMYAGQILTYRVRPLFNIPMFWMTEITHVEEGLFFVDEQRFGPYAFWHHQHHFKPVAGGVEMTDLLHYKMPFGPLGRLAHAVFVKKRLESIFDYRYAVLEKRFGVLPAQGREALTAPT